MGSALGIKDWNKNVTLKKFIRAPDFMFFDRASVRYFERV